MSDLSVFLSAAVSIAKKDFVSDVVPAVASALPAVAVNPSGAVPTLLAALATGGVKLAADEAVALEQWAQAEMSKLVAAIAKKV